MSRKKCDRNVAPTIKKRLLSAPLVGATFLSHFFLLVITPITHARAEDTLFEQVTPARILTFPKDHGSHPAFATEWWYFTGHLTDQADATYGFELTFFRVGVDPAAKSRSAWRAQSIYLAHFALTDDRGGRFLHFERASRGALEEAGASESGLSVWIREWIAKMENDVITIDAGDEGHHLALTLRPAKPLVLNGENGYSRKGPGPHDASYYASFPRLEGNGVLTLPGSEKRAVRASAWMDHEFTSSSLARGTNGWDWFALQLEGGEELMLYQLRLEDGGRSPFSAGTFVRADGFAQHLRAEDFTVEVSSRWTSPKTGISYPSGWVLTVPLLSLNFTVEPTVKDQELSTELSTGVTYWEGRSKVRGTKSGNAYVELVGYKKQEKEIAMSEVHEGSKAPEFALPNQRGETVKLGDIKDGFVILYFYPKDDTPGCTLEGQEFTSEKETLAKLGARVIGVSGGDVKSKKKFCDKYGLTIDLLADEDGAAGKKYGAYGQKQFMGRTFDGFSRKTFIIGPDRKIEKVYDKVKPEGHAAEVADYLRARQQ